MSEQMMDVARQEAAQCWCEDDTSAIEMDSRLAEAAARRIARWMQTASEMSANATFYRNLIHQIGNGFGAAARTSDDGSIQDEVLALKVPELVDALRSQLAALKAERDDMLASAMQSLVDAEADSISAAASPVKQVQAAITALANREDAAEAEVARLRNLTRLVVRPWLGGPVSFREWCEAVDALFPEVLPAPPPEEQ